MNEENRSRPDTLVILLSDFRKKSHKASVFNRTSKLSLITGLGASLAPWKDLSIWGDKTAKGFRILIVNVLHVILGEVADLFPRSHLFECHVFRFLSYRRQLEREIIVNNINRVEISTFGLRFLMRSDGSRIHRNVRAL